MVESGSGEESRCGGGGERDAVEEGRWWGREVEEGEVEDDGMEAWGGEEGGVRGGWGGVLGWRFGLVHCSSRTGLSWSKSRDPSVSATAAAMTEAGGRGGGAGGGASGVRVR